MKGYLLFRNVFLLKLEVTVILTTKFRDSGLRRRWGRPLHCYALCLGFKEPDKYGSLQNRVQQTFPACPVL